MAANPGFILIEMILMNAKNLGFGKDAVHCTPFCTAATTEADLS